MMQPYAAGPQAAANEAQIRSNSIKARTQCLEEQMDREKLDAACNYWNDRVERQTGRKLDLKINSVQPSNGGMLSQIAKIGFRVNIEANTPSMRRVTKNFYVLYAPSYNQFHAAIEDEPLSGYPGLHNICAFEIVKTMAIFTHGEQIPRI